LANLKLRDRDAPITKEGLIFRVFGYSHPSNAYICDAEYAAAKIFKSTNPKALRNQGRHVFYKFYEDEGWRFIQKHFPQYIVFHDMLHRKVVGVYDHDVENVRKPYESLETLIEMDSKDKLLAALENILEFTTQHSSLSTKDFGVFGSILHGFYHPKFSDIDLIIYGKRNFVRLYETLQEVYGNKFSPLRNEFETGDSVREKRWNFQNYSLKEYIWHQRRKMIYALFTDERGGRVIKTEFEPVKNWEEINNEYDAETRVQQMGWTKIFARVIVDRDAPFIPSIYSIEPLKVLNGARDAVEVNRIISYVEEFRMQARKDETIYVEGNLEKVISPKENYYQVVLTYCPRYYEQVLKIAS